jgi:type III secretory pathway component EscR
VIASGYRCDSRFSLFNAFFLIAFVVGLDLGVESYPIFVVVDVVWSGVTGALGIIKVEGVVLRPFPVSRILVEMVREPISKALPTQKVSIS